MKNINLENVTLIFDNGGGLTMQLPGFAHYYDDMEQAAEDYKAYLEDGTTEGWEGHEPETAELEPDIDDIRNGGYKVFSGARIEKILADPDYETSWKNVQDFIDALKNS